MGYGPRSVFPVVIASGAATSSAIDLTRAWSYCYLVIPTITALVTTSTCNIFIQGSADGVNYFNFCYPPQNTATTGVNTFTLANSISQCVVPIPNATRYMKVVLGNIASAGVASSAGMAIVGSAD